MTKHPGITMHKIPVAGAAGFLFVAATAATVLLGLPQIAPLAAVGAFGGLLLAPALYRWHAHSLTSLRGGTILFVLGSAFLLATGNDVLRAFVAISLVAGAVLADVLLRHAPQHPTVGASLIR